MSLTTSSPPPRSEGQQRSADEQGSSRPAEEVELEALARAVWDLLKEELRIEQERLGKQRW